MTTNQTRILIIGLLYLLIFASGFWLSKSGKPFNTIVLTIHKLISLAVLVLLIIIIYRFHEGAKLGAVELAFTLVMSLFFLSTIISGGFLSTGKSLPAAIRIVHLTTSILTVLTGAVMLFLLLFYKS